MKKKIKSLGLGFFALTAALLLMSCVPQTPPPTTANELAGMPREEPSDSSRLPVRFQNPSYAVKPLTSSAEFGDVEDSVVPIGADITSTVPIALRDIMKQLAQIKGMNISWANDVDQTATVDVNIRAEEDFFKSINSLLRQLDYFLEVRGNTLVIKHKAVRKYHIAMPFVATKYSSAVGGDVLGGNTEGGNMQGQVELTSSDNEFDIWKNIQENLDKVLEIWTAPTPKATPAPAPAGAGQQGAAQPAAAPAPSLPPKGKGYYTIDKPIGLITVTAPPSLLDKIDAYITSLKAELYRQVVIEAKIVEVTLNDDNTTGINWEDLLQNATTGFNFELDFQSLNPAHPNYGQFLTLNNRKFSLLLDAIQSQGTTNVIANPKISVMNGQPAMINIGENTTYISSVTSTENAETRSTTYTANTDTILSGVVLSVVPTIMEDNEIVLTLAPVTSQLQSLEYKTFGANSTVGLPVVSVREMSTMVRLKDNEMLVVGGLINNSEAETANRIPGLGDIPGLGKLFGTSGKVKKRTELVIFLKPRIVS